MKAFPKYAEKAVNREQGMDLRDYFAANCPFEDTGSVTWDVIRKFKKLPPNTPIEEWKPEYSLEWDCHKRYEWADAMISARGKRG